MLTKIGTKLNWKSAIILGAMTALAAIATTDTARSFVLPKAVYAPFAPVTTKSQSQRIVGIYQGRFELTANASEREIRDRVRHFRASGFNTIVQSVWGNGCAMYASGVTKKLTGTAHCSHHFNPKAVAWTIDETRKQGMQFHAYFETGIKIDRDSPIYSLAVQRNWLLPEMDTSDPQHPRYILDVANPEVAEFYQSVVAEFLHKYSQVDAVQFDDYLSYSPNLLQTKSSAERERLVTNLTTFVNNLVTTTKRANPRVNFDVCHFNNYWAESVYGADLANWRVDRRYVEAYQDENFDREAAHASELNGIAIDQRQLYHLPAVLGNSPMNVFVFPIGVKPRVAAALFARQER